MLEGLKFWLSVLFFCAVFGLSGYWVFTKIDSGAEYTNKQKISELQEENKELQREIKKLEQKLSRYEVLEAEKTKEVEVVVNKTKSEIISTEPTKTVVTNRKHAKLVSELEALIRENINMKLKSKGTRVGTIQNFLNIYNNTSLRIDNDYGESTRKAVANFQQESNLKVTGETGTDTYLKMIEWLSSQ